MHRSWTKLLLKVPANQIIPMILWFPWTPKSLIYSESGSPLSTPLTFKKIYTNFCMSTDLHPLNGEKIVPGKCRSLSLQLAGEQLRPTAAHSGPSFFSISINGSADLLLILTKISETSEQGLDQIKNPKWSFVAVLRCCCIRYILLPEKRAGRKKT